MDLDDPYISRSISILLSVTDVCYKIRYVYKIVAKRSQYSEEKVFFFILFTINFFLKNNERTEMKQILKNKKKEKTEKL